MTTLPCREMDRLSRESRRRFESVTSSSVGLLIAGNQFEPMQRFSDSRECLAAHRLELRSVPSRCLVVRHPQITKSNRPTALVFNRHQNPKRRSAFPCATLPVGAAHRQLVQECACLRHRCIRVVG